MAAKSGFTRVPKVHHLVSAGVPVEAIPTYCVLADHANNKNGLCWPKMETLAAGIGRSVRTIQRHLHILRDLGLVQFVHRRRSQRGRFSSYLYRVLAIPGMAASKKRSTTGHSRRAVKAAPLFTRTKQGNNTPHTPPTEGYEWLFETSRSSRARKSAGEGGNSSPGGALEAL